LAEDKLRVVVINCGGDEPPVNLGKVELGNSDAEVDFSSCDRSQDFGLLYTATAFGKWRY
jgi:hypothetical protein